MHGPVTCSAVLESNSGFSQSDEIACATDSLIRWFTRSAYNILFQIPLSRKDIYSRF